MENKFVMYTSSPEMPQVKQKLNRQETFACYLSFFIVFLIYEGFFILPDAVVVPLPGQFRIADSTFIIILLSFSAFLLGTIRSLAEHLEASLLVLTSCALIFLTVSMAKFTFGQSLLDGLLYIRHSFTYLLFFIFCTLLSTVNRLHFFLKIAAFVVTLLAFLALLQKHFPALPIFNFRSMGESQYLGKKNMRFGDYRLFFPNIEFTFFVYFMTLAELLNKRNITRLLPKLGFLCLIAYIVLATGTRVHLLAMTVVTLIAFVTGQRRSVKMVGIVLLILCISVETLSLAIHSEGISLFEENKFSNVIKYSMDTKEGSIQGRIFQNKMYWNNFLKSPLAGVGTLRYTAKLDDNYRKYGFYNNNDLGYMKILAEYGIVGIIWILWFYSYIFRKTKGVIATRRLAGEEDCRVFIAKGVQFYILYVAVSALTLPHFVEGRRIIPIVLAMVFIEAAHRSRPRIAASPLAA